MKEKRNWGKKFTSESRNRKDVQEGKTKAERGKTHAS